MPLSENCWTMNTNLTDTSTNLADESRLDVGDFIRFPSNSPSLYDEIFDGGGKQIDLTSDPFLSSNQGEQDIAKEVATTTQRSNVQPDWDWRAESMKKELEAESANLTGAASDFGSTEIPETATTNIRQHHRQVLPFLPTSTWPVADQQNLTTTNAVQQQISTRRSNPQPSMVRVKTEPDQDDEYLPPASVAGSSSSWMGEQDQEDGDEKAGSGHFNHHHRTLSSNSRGAMYAREYRRKTKRRVNQMEMENDRLWRDHKRLREVYANACDRMTDMEREIAYLRQVLANDSAIAKLLNNTMIAANTSNFKFQWPLSNEFSRQESGGGGSTNVADVSVGGREDPNATSRIGQQQQQPFTTADGNPGVCLHVNQDTVSVEFCPKCNRGAADDNRRR